MHATAEGCCFRPSFNTPTFFHFTTRASRKENSMRSVAALWFVLISCVWGCWSAAAEWRVGVARRDVTPVEKLWMSGYASRKHVADGAVHPLWAKALAIEDQRGERTVIVAVDLIGDEFGRELGDAVGKRVQQRSGIERRAIVINASHTHSGPVTQVTDGARVTYGLNGEQQKRVTAYCRQLENQLAGLIEDACRNLGPANLAFGEGQTGFAANRRARFNPDGPVDFSVPVLRVTDEQGRLLAVLFGYACHTATLGGDFYRYCGDYAGFAQIALEQRHPGSQAMFLAGCGGDINPSPRGKLELAEQHGKSLAKAVDQVLSGNLVRVRGPLKVALERVNVPFVDPPSKDDLEKRRGQGNVYDQRLTEVLLQRISRQGALEKSYPCPVQIMKFGEDLTLVALGGEVVVDYALRLRNEFAPRRIWVAGYSNEVFAYLPSERVLAEGGYEAGGAMRYFGWHGPFQPGVEDLIVGTVKRLMADLESNAQPLEE